MLYSVHVFFMIYHLGLSFCSVSCFLGDLTRSLSAVAAFGSLGSICLVCAHSSERKRRMSFSRSRSAMSREHSVSRVADFAMGDVAYQVPSPSALSLISLSGH